MCHQRIQQATSLLSCMRTTAQQLHKLSSCKRQRGQHFSTWRIELRLSWKRYDIRNHSMSTLVLDGRMALLNLLSGAGNCTTKTNATGHQGT
jgi:hypothetical protein